MQQEIKIIKRLILYGILMLAVSILVNVNSEKMYIQINSPLISNNLALTLLGGVCTGIIAVLFEKIYAYHLNRLAITRSIYIDAIRLYAEIHYWICNIKELIADRNIGVPTNLFSHKLPEVNAYINKLKSYDYCNFLRKDSVNKAYEVFREQDSNAILCVLSKIYYLPIAINQSKIDEIQKNIQSKDYIYKVLSILENQLLLCEERIENLIDEVSKNGKLLDWDKDKSIILKGYNGVYAQSLEDFINENIEI